MVEDNGEAIELDFNREGDPTTALMLEVFAQCITLQRRKGLTYGDAFRSQGYMGNVARVLSKVARLKNMVWRDWPIEDDEETVKDTALDLINLTAFFVLNRANRNKWGDVQ